MNSTTTEHDAHELTETLLESIPAEARLELITDAHGAGRTSQVGRLIETCPSNSSDLPEKLPQDGPTLDSIIVTLGVHELRKAYHRLQDAESTLDAFLQLWPSRLYNPTEAAEEPDRDLHEAWRLLEDNAYKALIDLHNLYEGFSRFAEDDLEMPIDVLLGKIPDNTEILDDVEATLTEREPIIEEGVLDNSLLEEPTEELRQNLEALWDHS